jgi:hypothetical protein
LIDMAAQQCFICPHRSVWESGAVRMRRVLAVALSAAMLAGCVTTAQNRTPSNTPEETSAVLGQLANQPAPGLPPTVAGAAVGNSTGPRCFGTDRYGLRVRAPC